MREMKEYKLLQQGVNDIEEVIGNINLKEEFTKRFESGYMSFNMAFEELPNGDINLQSVGLTPIPQTIINDRFKCFIDGDQLCIIESRGFVNLQHSKAFFIELTPEVKKDLLDTFDKTKKDEGAK